MSTNNTLLDQHASSAADVNLQIISPSPANATNGNLDRVRSLHRDIMCKTFPDDMEELEIWERVVTSDTASLLANPAEHTIFSFVVLTCRRSLLTRSGTGNGGDDTPSKKSSSSSGNDHDDGALVVCGGASIELYKRTATRFLAYVSIHPNCRGMGLGSRIVAESDRFLQTQALNLLGKPSPFLAILVTQKRDEPSCKEEHKEVDPSACVLDAHAFDPSVRQKIWAKLGFLPVACDVVCPGRLRGQRHQLAVLVAPEISPREHTDNDQQQQAAIHKRDDVLEIGFPKAAARAFLCELFEGILAEEGNFNDANGEIRELSQLIDACAAEHSGRGGGSGDFLKCAPECWW